MATWVNEVTVSQWTAGNIPMKVAGGYANVSRSGNTVTGYIGVRFQSYTSPSWTSNSITGWYGGVRRWAQKTTGGVHTTINTYYYCGLADNESGLYDGYQNTTESTPWYFSTTVSGTGSGNITVGITLGWDYYEPTQKWTYYFDVPYPAMPAIWNDINAMKPGGQSAEQNGLIFNLSTSTGDSWSNLTNEPTSFSYPVGTTATISNIRSNVTGAHYSGNSLTSGTPSSIGWTFTEPNYIVWLYTDWDTYQVTYDPNGGTTTPATQTKTYGQGLTLANAITRNNAEYAGYSVSFNPNGGSGSTTTEFAGLTITYSFYKWLDDDDTEYDGGGTYTKNKATTMWAAWDQTYIRGSVTAPAAPSRADSTATRTVTFNANGGTCDTPSLNSTATVSYTGLGWYAVDGTSITRRVVNGGTYTPTKDEMLYQQWSTTTGTFSSITLPTPRRSGYIFLGWNEDPTASSGITGSYTPASSVTLYALWELDRAQARMRIKQNGTWEKGFLWYNDNGEWKKVKNAYIKQNGTWIKSPY